MITAAHDVTAAQPAVTETSPVRMPLHAASTDHVLLSVIAFDSGRSRRPSQRSMSVALRPPVHPLSIVVAATRATSVEPPYVEWTPSRRYIAFLSRYKWTRRPTRATCTT